MPIETEPVAPSCYPRALLENTLARFEQENARDRARLKDLAAEYDTVSDSVKRRREIVDALKAALEQLGGTA